MNVTFEGNTSTGKDEWLEIKAGEEILCKYIFSEIDF